MLAQKNIFLEKEFLLSLVEKNNDVFKTFQSRNDTLISTLGKK